MGQLSVEQLHFAVPGGAAVAALFAVIALLLIAIALREQHSLAGRSRRVLLGSLRTLSVCLAWLYTVQPTWLVQRVEQLPGKIAVVLDTSRSMLVRDAGQTRIARAVQALRGFYDSAHEKPALFQFGAELTPLTRPDLDVVALPLHDDTRIEHALRTLLAGQSQDLGAVLLISDGADHAAQLDPQDLKRLGVRIHTLAIAESKEQADLALEQVRVDAAAFLRQTVDVDVTVRQTPRTADSVTLTLREGAELLRETNVALDENGMGSARVSFVPTRLGRGVYTLSLPTDADDAVPENNERAFQLQVTRERLRALLVCGHPSWDARYLRALLKGDPAVDLITFFILRTQNDNSMAPAEELSLIPFPTEELFEQHLASFDLVIFQDFDFAPYQMARYLPRIREYVLNGGSFAMLGGDRSFAAGGYGDTPISEILPVRLPERTPFVDESEFAPSIVPDASHHPLVELAPRAADNVELWRRLAPLVGTNLVGDLREGAHALLVHPAHTTASGAAMPVLAVSAPGRGRSLALTTDSAYRWGMATAGRTGDASMYERFWDRALRWLARDPLLDAAQISTDRASYGPGANMRVQVWLRDDLYQPRTPGPFRVVVTDHHGKVERELAVTTDANGRGTLPLNAPLAPSAYTLAAFVEGSPQPLAEQGFIVEAGGDELAAPRARSALLQQIARATGGEFFATPQALSSADVLPSTRTRVIGSDLRAPFASAWFFVLLLAAFGAEWWLRRRAGLR